MKPATTLHTPSGSWPRLLTAGGLAVILALTGCGKNGADGTAGSDGADGVDAPVVIQTPTALTAVDNAPGVVISNVVVTGQTGAGGYFKVGDVPVVTFTVKKSNGTAWYLGELGSGRIMISGPTSNYQRVLPSASDVLTRAVDNGGGSYTYTFASGLPATYAAPYYDTTTYGAADGELQGQALLDGAYTVGLVLYWNYTVNGVAKKDVGNATQDILVGPTAVAAAREVVKNDNCNACHVKIQGHGGSYQTTKLCVLCHTAGMEDKTHTALTEFKVMIHKIHNGAHLPSVNGVATNVDGTRNYAATPAPYTVAGTDFSAVNFPVWPSFSSAMPRDSGYSALTTAQKAQEAIVMKGVVACYKCHGDSDGTGTTYTAPSQGGLHTTQPSRRACGACHDDIDWTKPYTANGMTMPAQTDDATCATCHATTGTTAASGITGTGLGTAIPFTGTLPSTPFAHVHPLGDSTRIAGVSEYSPGLNINITGKSGNAAAYFVAGEKPAITFTVTNDAGADVPLYSLSAINSGLTGPTNNRQDVFPIKAGATGNTITLCDFSGRLVSSSSTDKGIMSRVVGSTVSETLKVQFSSAVRFSVTGGGSALTALGTSDATTDLPGSPSTNPDKSSVSAIELTTAAVAQTITINFTTAVAFTVTGSVSGAMGSGTMPASVNAVTRFTSTDGSLSFTITSGANTFATGNNIYMTVFRTSSNGHIFALVAGRASFSVANNDRFFYETVDNTPAVTPPKTYTYNLPMDILLERVGVSGAAGSLGTGVVGQVFPAVANLPLYWGRETVYERTAVAAGTTLGAAAAVRDTSITLAITAAAAGLVANDYIVLDNGVAGIEEHLQVLSVNGSQVLLTTPLRYAHAITTGTCNEVTLTQLFETINYTVDPTTGVITSVIAVGLNNPLVINYRTKGAFGWKRYTGDTVNATTAVYPLTLEHSTNLGQDWGKWQGLAYQNGTYTAALWGSKPTYLTRYNETQAYSYTSKAGQYNVLYGAGAAGSETPYSIVSSQDSCDKCHDGVLFHGGNRKSMDACLTCHGIAGAEDNTRTGITVNFRTMLHKIHMGEELTNASTYSVNGTVGGFAEVVFPAMPGSAKSCETCHGTDNTAWKVIATRAHASQTTPTKNWKVVCSSCHDAVGHSAHMDLMTTASGAEACVTCHGPGKELGVDMVHKNR